MQVLGLLRVLCPDLDPTRTKVHLAGLNRTFLPPKATKPAATIAPGDEQPADPLNEFFAGRFEAWQGQQSQKNFGRPKIVSLIQLEPGDRWLFAGVYLSKGCRDLGEGRRLRYRYETEPLPQFHDLVGRLVVRYKRTGRASYRNGETLFEDLHVDSIRPERMRIRDFPGFLHFSLSRLELELIVNEGYQSWRSSLGGVAGVYLITDTATGKHYVGSATGKGGIWLRWAQYAKTGHGGNKALKALLAPPHQARVQHFQYSVLETADTKASTDEVLAREVHWKTVLRSREFGLNGN